MRGVAPGEAMNKLMISSGFLADAKWWRTGNVNVGEFYCILVFILFSLYLGGDWESLSHNEAAKSNIG